MENIVARPRNEDSGKPVRDQRIPVQVSQDEKSLIENAADGQGMAASTWMRWLALREAKKDGD